MHVHISSYKSNLKYIYIKKPKPNQKNIILHDAVMYVLKPCAPVGCSLPEHDTISFQLDS